METSSLFNIPISKDIIKIYLSSICSKDLSDDYNIKLYIIANELYKSWSFNCDLIKQNPNISMVRVKILTTDGGVISQNYIDNSRSFYFLPINRQQYFIVLAEFLIKLIKYYESPIIGKNIHYELIYAYWLFLNRIDDCRLNKLWSELEVENQQYFVRMFNFANYYLANNDCMFEMIN